MGKFLKQYDVLIFKAKEDLITAKYLLDGFNNHNLELKLDIIFFHLQQCTEKLIKSVLDFSGIKFPYSHDIEELVTLLQQNNIQTIPNIQRLIPLTEYAVDSRYVVIHDDLEDIDGYLEIVDELFLFVNNERSRLQK